MPSQRETRVKGQALTVVGGVNERTGETQLPPYEYSLVQGSFPEFAGLQSRLWGKRLLGQYTFPIMGIFQFWTPQGYGVGLYQFEGSLDYGYWITPASSFNLTLPSIPSDLGDYTLDEFGYPYGSNFGYNTDNSCLISFLDGGTDHLSCVPPPAPMNTPDDSNGGPAGQGTNCRYEVTPDEIPLANFVVSQVSGSIVNTQSILIQDNCRNPMDGFNPPCVAYPTFPYPVGAIPEVSSFATQANDGILTASKNSATSAAFTPATNPTCSQNTAINQGNNSSQNKIIVDFSSLIGTGYDSVTLVVTQSPSGDTEEVGLTISETPYELDAKDFLVLPAPIPNDAPYGQRIQGSCTADTVKVYYRRRVCT